MVVGSNPIAVNKLAVIAPDLSNELFDIQATLECGFTLKPARASQEHTVKCTVQINIENTAQ